MKYYMVTDIENDDIYFCKAQNERVAIIKAQRVWNSNDPYVDFKNIKVKETNEKEYKKYVKR